MSGVSFERLPPERRIAAPTAASAGSCCCCCCCCLHTVGSIVGALTAKTPKPPDAVPTAVVGGSEATPRYSVRKEYWVTLLILSTVAFPILLVATDIRLRRIEEWLLMYAIFMPGIQLAATVVVGVRNTFSKRPGLQERINHLGSITVRAFIGTLAGLLIMLLLFVAR
jgi:hypothetical protein